MELLKEAGPFGPLAVMLFITGLAFVVRSRSAKHAAGFALAILAVGQLGQGLGQHAVRDALSQVPDIGDKVAMLNAGTGEAASSLIISGACALLLCVIGSFVSLADKRTP
jgi:hypothetical protein